MDHARSSQEKCTSLEKDKEDILKKMKQVVVQLKCSQESVIEMTKEKDALNKKISLLEKESLTVQIIRHINTYFFENTSILG